MRRGLAIAAPDPPDRSPSGECTLRFNVANNGRAVAKNIAFYVTSSQIERLSNYASAFSVASTSVSGVTAFSWSNSLVVVNPLPVAY